MRKKKRVDWRRVGRVWFVINWLMLPHAECKYVAGSMPRPMSNDENSANEANLFQNHLRNRKIHRRMRRRQTKIWIMRFEGIDRPTFFTKIVCCLLLTNQTGRTFSALE